MKLLIITPSFYPAICYGGPIFSIYHTCIELSKLGIEVKVASSTANGDKHLEVEPDKFLKLRDLLFVKYYKDTIIGRFSWNFTKGIKNDIKNSDIAHLQNVFSLHIPISLFYSKKYNKKIIISSRGAFCKWCLAGKKAFFKKLWIKFLILPFINKIIWHVTSEDEKKDVLTIFPNTKTFIIPNGININDFNNFNILNKEEYCTKFTGIFKDKIGKIVISVGRIHKVKCFDILIKSFKKVLVQYPDSILLIAGEDQGELNNLLKQVSNLNLDGSIFFIGQINNQDKIDFYANADIFVLASHNENFGNVYLESLASGTPIVATKGTPWKEVEIKNCGKWVDNNPNEIANAINVLLSQDSKLLKQNSIKFSKKFSWKSVAEDFKLKYEAMLINN